MKKILLIGDSIRKGYDAYVRESMAGLAKVYFPEENCTFTTNILRFLHVWADNLKLYDADAVHFNAGLWDTLRIYGDDVLVKPDTYADNLKRIVSRIRFLFPNAKILFATTTPVREDGYFTDFESRTNDDVRRYNQIARDIFPERTLFSTTYTPLRRSFRKAIIRIKRTFTQELPPKSSAARCATRYAMHCGWIKVS